MKSRFAREYILTTVWTMRGVRRCLPQTILSQRVEKKDQRLSWMDRMKDLLFFHYILIETNNKGKLENAIN